MPHSSDNSETKSGESAYDGKDIQRFLNAPELQRQLYKRTLAFVVISQIFGGAGLAAGVTVGALLAQDMLGSESVAGLPAALLTLGSAGAAFLVGRISQRYGRRFGLASGFLAGGFGAMGVVTAAALHSIGLLFISLLIYGAGTATNLQARYAGTDLAKPTQRATAVSIAMVATTFGAVAGPNMVDITGNWADSLGLPPLTGLFLLAAVAFLFAGLALFAFLRPDPLIVAKALAKAQQMEQREQAQKSAPERVNRNRGIVVGATIMVLTQIVMVAIMTMTPVHMQHHGHELAAVGLVISLHIAAMYLPSLITGILVDKLGRTTMTIASGGTLLASGLLAAAAPADSMLALTIALVLLGLGWNFGLISGTALIIDATTPETRAKTQGTVDVLIALSGASGGAMSGVVVAHASYEILSLAGGILSLLLIPVVIWSRREQTKKASDTNSIISKK